jgi:hypothetical protein
MADCEWNPTADREAFEGDPPHGEATVMVGADGKYHLCDACARLPRFARYRVRRPLGRRVPERVQRKQNREARASAGPRVRVQVAKCELFASYPMRCPLCGTDVPANTAHSCSKATR